MFGQPHPQEMAEGAGDNSTGLSPNAEEVLARAKEVSERKFSTEFDPAIVEENLASVRRTLAAIDDLNDRWKVNIHLSTRARLLLSHTLWHTHSLFSGNSPPRSRYLYKRRSTLKHHVLSRTKRSVPYWAVLLRWRDCARD